MNDKLAEHPIVVAWIADYRRGLEPYSICEICRWPHAENLVCGAGATFGRARFGSGFAYVDESNVRYLLNLRLTLSRGFHWKDDIYFERDDNNVVISRIEYFNGTPAIHQWTIPDAEWQSIVEATIIAALRRSQPEGMVTVRGMKLADEMVDAMNQCRLSLEGSARQAEWRSAHDKARRELFAMLSAAEAEGRKG